ncbi:MAG: hypothetical protein AMJ93_16260 [Anaerolineae bacterium SM23_84]|nr:MAG: hypothetical protein AMJ93_16260 [Anaerolineae bacterium SM23_84]
MISMMNQASPSGTGALPEGQQFVRCRQAGLPRVAWLILAVVGLALLAAACARDKVGTPSLNAPPCCETGENCMHADLNKERDTDRHVYTFKMDESITSTSLRLVVETRGGSLTWRLLDPNGQVRWEDYVPHKLSSKETREFESIVGVWSLEMDTQSLRGGYDIC